jgi:hypothetical protein
VVSRRVVRRRSALAIAALILAAPAGTARADFRFTTGNDLFADLDPPIEDDGFTNDIGLALWRPAGPYLVGGSLLHRWITEDGGFRRWDQVELLATVERPWGRYVVTSARLGPTVGGNWGGRWIQDRWHRLTGDRTLGSGLQDDYPGDRTVALLAGGELRASIGSFARGYAVLDGQVALGQTGLTYVEGAAGGQLVGRIRCVELAAHVELAIARYHVGDDIMALPGGYGVSGWEPQWRAGFHVAWRRIKLAYEYRANEGGSGEPIGTVTLVIRRPGESF